MGVIHGQRTCDHRRFRGTVRVATVAAAAMVVVAAAGSARGAVIQGDTFDVSVVGFDADGDAGYLAGPIDATFGTTQTFTKLALGGQVVTVTSAEVVGPSTTTDTITISVPVNFDPTGTLLNGEPIVELTAEFGTYFGNTDPLNLAAAVDPSTVDATGQTVYLTDATFNLEPEVTFSAGNTALSEAETLSTSGVDAAAYGFDSFTFTTSYATPASATAVPEPASVAAQVVAGTAGLTRRRRRTVDAGHRRSA